MTTTNYCILCEEMGRKLKAAEDKLQKTAEMPRYRIRPRSEGYPDGQWWECSETGEWLNVTDFEAIIEDESR